MLRPDGFYNRGGFISKLAKIVCKKCGFINELDLDDLIVLDTPSVIKISCRNCKDISEINFNKLIKKYNEKKEVSAPLRCEYNFSPIGNMPIGSIEVSGVKYYRPGSGGRALNMEDYIKKYGINPEVVLQKKTK